MPVANENVFGLSNHASQLIRFKVLKELSLSSDPIDPEKIPDFELITDKNIQELPSVAVL